MPATIFSPARQDKTFTTALIAVAIIGVLELGAVAFHFIGKSIAARRAAAPPPSVAATTEAPQGTSAQATPTTQAPPAAAQTTPSMAALS
ncbi:MAG: hypothetical protein LC642_03460, partial [Verrucomicrobiaceae bacterium]|nr:hypothetical protein [Verrucomicrobiaceae bacterium]